MSDPTNPDLSSLLKSTTHLDVLSFFWSVEESSPSLVKLSCYPVGIHRICVTKPSELSFSYKNFVKIMTKWSSWQKVKHNKRNTYEINVTRMTCHALWYGWKSMRSIKFLSSWTWASSKLWGLDCKLQLDSVRLGRSWWRRWYESYLMLLKRFTIISTKNILWLFINC